MTTSLNTLAHSTGTIANTTTTKNNTPLDTGNSFLLLNAVGNGRLGNVTTIKGMVNNNVEAFKRAMRTLNAVDGLCVCVCCLKVKQGLRGRRGREGGRGDLLGLRWRRRR